MKLASVLILAILSLTGIAAERNQLIDIVHQRGTELSKTIKELESSPQLHPDKFNFRGNKAQRQAAFKAQEIKHAKWILQYKPAVAERKALKDAYRQLIVCNESEVNKIAVELSGILNTSQIKNREVYVESENGLTESVLGTFRSRKFTITISKDSVSYTSKYDNYTVPAHIDNRSQTAKWNCPIQNKSRYISQKNGGWVNHSGNNTWSLSRVSRSIAGL